MSSGKSYAAEVQRPRSMFVAALWLCSAVIIRAALYLAVHALLAFVVLLASYASIFGLAFLMKRFPTRRRGALTVRDNVLLLDGRPILERRNIRGVFPVIASETSVLIEQRRIRMRSPMTIELASHEDAQALINDLGWDVAHAAQEFALLNTLKKRSFPWKHYVGMTAVTLAVVLSLQAFHVDPGLTFLLMLGTALAAGLPFSLQMLRKMNTKVRVGTDGLLITLTGKTRFIPYQQLASVERSANKVILHLSSGDPVELSHGDDNALSRATSKLNPVSQTDALFQRIENARALFSSRAEIRSQLLAALKRDGRSLEDWRRAASSVSQNQYRVAATNRDVLETIVQDSAIAPDVRIGAALALHGETGTRVRVATETSALPELGAAIDAALDGHDDILERAMLTLKL